MVWILRTIFFTPLPLNEDDDNFDEKLNDINYKITIRKLHAAGLGNSYFTFSDVYMLGYGCGMSQYHQFYYKYLDRYQLLQFPYRDYFEGFPGYKFVKEKWVLDLAYQAKLLPGKILKKKQRNIGQLWKKHLQRQNKSYRQNAELGKRFYLYGCH